MLTQENSLYWTDGIEPWGEDVSGNVRKSTREDVPFGVLFKGSLHVSTAPQVSKARCSEIRRRRKVTQRRRTLRRVLIAALVVAVLGAAVNLAWAQLDIPWLPFRSSASISADVAAQVTYEIEPFELATQLTALDDTGFLDLISASHALEQMPDISDFRRVSDRVAASREDMVLHPVALSATADFINAGHAQGFGPFHVASGFRSFERQAELYEQVGDSSLVQPAGHSEHHTGLAIDLVPTELTAGGGSLSSLLDGSSPDERWLADNAWRYGFILRYPEGASAVTGIAFEPWHFRYVGAPHAWYLWHHQLTLEEYLDMLEARGGYDLVIGQRSYSVRHQTPEDGVIYVPSNKEFSVSGDNRGTGSAIVTAWEQKGD